MIATNKQDAKQQRIALYRLLKSGFGEAIANNMSLNVFNIIEKAKAVLVLNKR